MFDLIVTAGKAVMPSGSAEPADIGVSGGRAVPIETRRQRVDAEARRLADLKLGRTSEGESGSAPAATSAEGASTAPAAVPASEAAGAAPQAEPKV